MKKIFPLLLSAALFISFNVRAQTRDTTYRWMRHTKAGAVQIQLTYRQADISGLNQALTADGLRPISPNNVWLNLSMHHIDGNFITEDGVGLTPLAMSSNNGLYAKYNQYQVFFRFAYNILPAGDAKLYPFAGLNLSAAVLDIDDDARLQNTGSLAGELLNNTSSKTLYQPNFGIELGAGFDYLIPVKAKQIDCFVIKRNIPVGVRVGYYINTYSSDWKVDNYGLAGGNQKQSAVFASFNIGLGYELSK